MPTLTFRLLYCFFVIEHDRRRVLYFNVTRHPTSDWVVQQLREAFPEAGQYRYVILDRDSKFDADVITLLKATGLKPKRTSIRSPWQNGTAERWVGSCRRELLDHVITLDERHLRRLVREYVAYHVQDRTHDSLEKDAPNRRAVERKPSPVFDGNLQSAARWPASSVWLVGSRVGRFSSADSTLLRAVLFRGRGLIRTADLVGSRILRGDGVRHNGPLARVPVVWLEGLPTQRICYLATVQS